MNVESDREHNIGAAISAIRHADAGKAKSLCRALIDQDPTDAEASSFLGLALLGQDTKEALAALAEAVRLEPREPRWRVHLGTGLGRAGRLVDAERACCDAVMCSHGAPDTLLPWAESLAALNRFPDAVEAVRRAIDNESSGAADELLARLLISMGE